MRRCALVLCMLIWLLLGVACGDDTGDVTSEDFDRLVQEGQDAIDRQDYERAISVLGQAIRGQPASARARFLLGNAYAQNNQLPQAEEQLLKALQLESTHTDARSNLGVVYYRQGKLQEAAEAFRVALQQQPNDAEIHYNLGGVLAAQNRLDEAVTEFLRARDLDPSLPEPYLGLGSVYKLQGRRDEAAANLREYLRLSKDASWRAQAEQMLQELGEKP